MLELSAIRIERGRRESGRQRSGSPAGLTRGNHDQHEKNIEQHPDAQDNKSNHHPNLLKKYKEYERTLASRTSEGKVLKESAVQAAVTINSPSCRGQVCAGNTSLSTIFRPDRRRQSMPWAMAEIAICGFRMNTEIGRVSEPTIMSLGGLVPSLRDPGTQ